ncbi:unnamed protein product [Lathyrus sativus]|nr:unnamed protein product [Lathyrus sativus]
MESKLLKPTYFSKPSTPFSYFHLSTRGSSFSFNPISSFSQKSNLSLKVQAASIGSVPIMKRIDGSENLTA